jgi:integrase
MATAFWRTDKRTGSKVLVAKWRDAAARGGWRSQRRANDRTKRQAEEYAREMEKKAERVLKGLETDPGRITFGELLDWWWKRHGQYLRNNSKHLFHSALQKHLASLQPFILTPGTAGAFADALDRLLSEKGERKELGPKTLNHLRAGAFRIFECARNPKARLWSSENPVRWVPRRKVPKRKYDTLRRDEVRPVLDALPELALGKPWRGAAAVCLYAGARPGEALGLWKEDVDTEEWVLTIRRSWTEPWPKDDEPRAVLIVPELRPFLADAMRLSPNHLVFPRVDGEPWLPDTRRLLVDHLRRACAAAGVVLGYDHTCRRCKARAARAGDREAAAKLTTRYPDALQRHCPECGMKLWITPIPRPVRFYDLRHTHATLLRKARVDLGTVQKALGHSSPEITAAIYDHSELEDDRAALEKALTFRAGTAPVTPSPLAAPRSSPVADAEIVRTTGAPKLTTPRTDSAPYAPEAGNSDRVIPSPCDPVRPVITPATPVEPASGPRGRRFKSCLPDHLKARHHESVRVTGFLFPSAAVVRFVVRSEHSGAAGRVRPTSECRREDRPHQPCTTEEAL